MGANLQSLAGDADKNADAYMTAAGNAVGIVPVYGGAFTFLVDGVLDAGGPNSLRKGWSDNEETQVKADQTLQWNARQDVRVEIALAMQRAGIINTGFSERDVNTSPTVRTELQAWLDGGNLPDDVSSVLNDLDRSFTEGVANGSKK